MLDRQTYMSCWAKASWAIGTFVHRIRRPPSHRQHTVCSSASRSCARSPAASMSGRTSPPFWRMVKGAVERSPVIAPYLVFDDGRGCNIFQHHSLGDEVDYWLAVAPTEWGHWCGSLFIPPMTFGSTLGARSKRCRATVVNKSGWNKSNRRAGNGCESSWRNGGQKKSARGTHPPEAASKLPATQAAPC